MSKIEPCMETVNIWIENLLKDEIGEILGSMDNDQLWSKMCNSQEERDMLKQNIANYEAYLEWLRTKLKEVTNE